MTTEGITTVNPASNEPLEFYPYTSAEHVQRKVCDARAAHLRLRRTTVGERVNLIGQLGAILAERYQQIVEQIVVEMGKPILQAEAEIDKCIQTCEYYAQSLPTFCEPRTIDVYPDMASVHLRPLGVILAIMPWNYPWWQVIRAVLPAIALGNTVVLKHADSVSGSAYAVEDAFCEAFGEAVLNTVVVPGDRVHELIASPEISGVAFTGSERVGAIVASQAGTELKKCVLELGGSDPFIVLDDADIERAAEAAVRSRLLNNGQSCIAAKRIIVHERVRGPLIEAMRPHVDALRVGDPINPATDVGPLARIDLLTALRGQEARAKASGAETVAVQATPSRPGAWYSPKFMTVPDLASPLMIEETFGPLGAIISAEDTTHAIEIANDSKYGLSSSIWSQDVERVQHVAEQLQAGSVFINTISASDPRLPVGGMKASGFGRELADYGVTEFANVQAVRVATEVFSTGRL